MGRRKNKAMDQGWGGIRDVNKVEEKEERRGGKGMTEGET